MYQPQPIDTSQETLPKGLTELLEQLARHNHDIWAQKRIAEGWTFGSKRDDEKKQHPGLVPYEELSESEKDYDRETSLEAIKAILKLDYQIKTPSESAAETGGVLAKEIEQANGNIGELMAIWNAREKRDAEWDASSLAFRLLARQFLSNGAPLIALEVLNEGLQHFESDLLLLQLQGLALVRTGAAARANTILENVRKESEHKPEMLDAGILEETLGLLARTHKDLGLFATNETDRLQHLQKSLNLYKDAYERTGHRYWTGINVATLATLLNQTELANITAQQVQNRCQEELENTQPDDRDRYWILATLGEAALNLRDIPLAETYYRKAADCGEGRYGDINTTRRQARLLLAQLGHDEELADAWLPTPGVVVFSGHMIDQPHREQERFPERFANAVKTSIREWLIENNIRIGYSSAASGSDLLFQEALKEIGGECHIVLPYARTQFVKDSVDITENKTWVERFDAVMKQAAHTVYTSNQKMKAGSVSYDYANLVLHGLASVRARELETEPEALVVWNGKKGDGPGGTASVTTRWHSLGVPVTQIDLSTLPDPVPERLPTFPVTKNLIHPNGRRVKDSETEVMAMLFADAVNFAQLTEEEVPKFVSEFLGGIALIVREYKDRNVVRNTWGDGLYLVFKTVRDAGICALQLQEMAQKTNWEEKGLPKGLTLRIALHAGPVFGGPDPVTGNMNYTGTHVSRAARLEPKTPPGEVYASEAFAALAAVDKVDETTEFVCEYVKQLEWAKHYGTFPTYVLRKGPLLEFKKPVE